MAIYLAVLGAGLGLLLSAEVNMAAAQGTGQAELQAQVVIVGATPGGVAAAVAAGRSGRSVILLEESGHVGGIISGGLTNTDIRKQAAVGGLFQEFTRRVREDYVKRYGEKSEQVKVCRNGNMFEPHVAERVFGEMLSGEKSVRVMLRQRLVGVKVMGSDGVEREAVKGVRKDGAEPKEWGAPLRVTAVEVEEVRAAHGQASADSGLPVPPRRRVIRGEVFIDATYEGDLAARAGVPYRVGRESRATFGEPHAGRVYVKFGQTQLLPGSTGEGDDGIQAFCFRFHMTSKPGMSVPVEKPAGYRREDYRHLLADIQAGKVKKINQAVQFYLMPNGKYEINSDHPHTDTGVPSESLDLAEELWGWPEADYREREKMFARCWAYQEGLIWFLQHDEEVPEALRKEALAWGFAKDEFTDNRNRPHAIYVRQGRRIWGEYNFTQRDADLDPATRRPARKPDAVAVAEFPFDSHAVHKFDPAHPGVREGYIFVDHPPLQLPYRIMVPRRVDGLLVPVACSASHVGYQCLRVEPVFMALGEAAGVAGAEAVRAGVTVRKVDVAEVQKEIVRRKGVILWEEGK